MRWKDVWEFLNYFYLIMDNKFLIIDCDGTLVDTSIDIFNAVNLSLSFYGLSEISKQDVLSYIGNGVYPLLKKNTPLELQDEILKKFNEFYSSSIVKHSQVYSGWDEIFALFPKDNIVVLSNKPQVFLNEIVIKLFLDSKISAWYGREAFKEIKPSPLPIDEILLNFKVDRSKAFIIGDMPSDILAGKGAKIKTIAALYGYSEGYKLKKLEPDYIINKPNELISIL